MATSQDFRPLLEELFQEVDVVPDDLKPLDTAPSIAVGRGADSLMFRGRALELLHRITSQESEHWSSGGWTAESVKAMVIDACRAARAEGPESGVQTFLRRLASPPAVWTVYLAAQDIFYHWDAAEGVNVGGATFTRQEVEVGEESILAQAAKDIGPPFWRVQVAARDQRSAHFLAHERIQQSRAILALSDNSIRRPLPAALLTRGGGVWGASGTDVRLFIHAIDSDGGLLPGYKELSQAAQRPEVERLDWPRRVLSASRWYLKAATVPWYAEALSAAATALECLLIRDRREKQKGRLVGERATRIARLHRFEEEDQLAWLEDLYKRRNDTVHEGLSVVEDLHVEALVTLTGALCEWAAFHLSALHRHDGEPCSTFDDAHDASQHS